MHWYIVHSRPRAEKAVADNLKRAGFEYLRLHYKGTWRHARRTRTVEKPYFPRYVFVGCDNGLVLAVNRFPGVSTLVYAGEQPLEVPGPVIEELRARGDEDGLVRLSRQEQQERERRPFAIGEHVRVINGPLIGFLGLVSLDNGEQFKVWLDGFGGKVEATLAASSLESASPEWGLVAPAA